MYMLTEYCQLTLGKVVLSKGLDGRKKKLFFLITRGMKTCWSSLIYNKMYRIMACATREEKHKSSKWRAQKKLLQYDNSHLVYGKIRWCSQQAEE